MDRFNSAAVDAINDLIRKYAQVLEDADINWPHRYGPRTTR